MPVKEGQKACFEGKRRQWNCQTQRVVLANAPCCVGQHPLSSLKSPLFEASFLSFRKNPYNILHLFPRHLSCCFVKHLSLRFHIYWQHTELVFHRYPKEIITFFCVSRSFSYLCRHKSTNGTIKSPNKQQQ